MRLKSVFIQNALAVLTLVCWSGGTSFAQSARVDRVAGRIAGSPAVWLEGNRRPMFRPENDQGPVADSLRLENITLSFKPTEEQQANLAALLEQQQDPSSPQYHRWLTPEQFADSFGMTANDVAKVTDWLTSQGFTISQIARSRNWVSFTGTAAQVQSAFHTEIHNYSWRGETYYANATEPAVPAVLADVVLGITSLDNYHPKPHVVIRQLDAGPNPEFTSYLSGKNFVAPGDFAVIYGVNALYSNGIDGTNQSIAVVGQTDLYNGGSDIATFRSVSGLPVKAPQIMLVGSSDPGFSSGDYNEASLDLEWSGAVAKNATIIYVNSTDAVNVSLKTAITSNLAPVITVSYGLCEPEWGASARSAFEGYFAQANSQGQTIVVASGDSGAADCDYSTSTSTVTSATHGLAVDYPASSAYVTAMGGSEFNEGVGNYWSPASGGVDVSPSALSYIPEMAWNDTTSTLNTTGILLAGGGGVSAYYPKPSWQTGTGVPSDGFRDVPDLSMNSSPEHDGYLVCVQGSCANGYRVVSSDPTLNNTLKVAGGTSAGSPTFGGIVALINQKMGSSQGNINQELYSLAAMAPAAFHDITTGNNMVPCTMGSTGCAGGGSIGYSATVGYDQATGLGSVNAYNLATAWASSTAGNLPAPTLSLPANGATGVALSPIFTWTAVNGNNGYRIMIATSTGSLPTNPATITCSACTVVNTTAANTVSYIPPSPLPQGTYYWQVQAIEPSSSTGTAAWSSVFGFTTNGVALAAPTLMSPANGTTGVAIQPTFTWTAVTGNSGYRILIATTQAALPTSPSAGTCAGCTISGTAATESFTPGSTSFAGGTTYYWEVQATAPSGGGLNGTWSTVFSFTTAPGDFSLSASPSSVTIAPGGSATSTLTVTPINNFSGTLNLSCSVSSSLAGVTCSGSALSSNTFGVTIIASSTAKTYPAPPRNPPMGGWWVAGAAMLCLLLIASFKLRQGGAPVLLWSLPRVAMGAVLALLLVASFSCGGGNSGGGGGGGATPQPESGTVTVTGSSSNATHTATINVSVT